MNAKLVNAAAGVLLAAMEQGKRTAAGLAIALESAQLLQSPETAAELVSLRARLAEYERPADEDPIAYVLTAEADGITRRIAPVQALRAELGGDR